MDRLISENKVLEAIDNLKVNFTCYDSVTLDEVASHIKAISSAEPSGDFISRQAAIKSIEERAKGIKNEEIYEIVDYITDKVNGDEEGE